MNILVLHGSPRKGGNSDTLAATFLQQMTAICPCEVRHFYLNDMQIQPCQGCLHCAADPSHACRLQDDMQSIYDAFGWANLVVWATPMYWGYMTAQMKTALDRMESLVWANGWSGKTFAVFLTYNHHVASTVGFFERVCPFFGTPVHIVTCHTFDETAGKPLAASEMPASLEECRALARKLATAQD